MMAKFGESYMRLSASEGKCLSLGRHIVYYIQ